MRITIFFKRSKGKQVICPTDAFFVSEFGNRISNTELADKVKALIHDIAGNDILDYSFEVL